MIPQYGPTLGDVFLALMLAVPAGVATSYLTWRSLK